MLFIEQKINLLIFIFESRMNWYENLINKIQKTTKIVELDGNRQHKQAFAKMTDQLK